MSTTPGATEIDRVMQVNVKLFGPQAAAAGCPSVEVELGEGAATCAALRRALAAACPAVAESLPASRFAVNCELVGEDHPISARDEIALIGMVSGG